MPPLISDFVCLRPLWSRVQEQFKLVQQAAAEIGDDLQVFILAVSSMPIWRWYRMLREGEVSTDGRFQVRAGGVFGGSSEALLHKGTAEQVCWPAAISPLQLI